MGLFKRLFALPKSPGLKAIALMLYIFIAVIVFGVLVNLFGGV